MSQEKPLAKTYCRLLHAKAMMAELDHVFVKISMLGYSVPGWVEVHCCHSLASLHPYSELTSLLISRHNTRKNSCEI